MNNLVHAFTTHDLAQFSHKDFMDDRQDYLIEVLNNIIDLNENNIEDRILAFEKLSLIYWDCIDDLDKSLEYINRAIELANSTNIAFSHVLRGALFNTRFKLLQLLDRTDEIEVEILRIIDMYKTDKSSSNSCLYTVYKYKANEEYNRGNFETALGYLMDAQQYYPVKFYANNLHEIEISDYKDEYDNLELLLSRNVCGIKDWQI